MMNLTFSEEFKAYYQSIAGRGLHQAARGFSRMLNTQLSVSEPVMRFAELNELADIFGGPEIEAVGVYLRTEGAIPGQIMVIIPLELAFKLVDLLLELPEGTTQELGSLERSALGEVGNLTGTFFINAVAEDTGLDLRPTPPATIVDMLGAILDIIIATAGGISDQVLLIKSTFVLGERGMETDFCVIPDPETLRLLAERK